MRAYGKMMTFFVFLTVASVLVACESTEGPFSGMIIEYEENEIQGVGAWGDWIVSRGSVRMVSTWHHLDVAIEIMGKDADTTRAE